MFYDKKCTIYSVTYTKVWGTGKRTYTAIYTDIECNFQKSKENLRNTDYANNVDLPKYTVTLPIKYNQVREAQKILLTDPDLWNMGEYIIGTVQADRSQSGTIDCITLHVHEMKWQL